MVAATGVIGQTLNVAVIEQGMPELCAAAAHTAAGSDAAAHAIMTTDTVKKELAVETVIGGKTVRMGGIAKGSGMIHPNMGTMLCFLTTDCAISSEMIKSALLETVQVSFNRISVDGDTSTNDTCCVLANGLAGNPVITEKGPDRPHQGGHLRCGRQLGPGAVRHGLFRGGLQSGQGGCGLPESGGQRPGVRQGPGAGF